MVFDETYIDTKTRDSLIAICFALAHGMASDENAVVQHLNDPKKPLYIILGGSNGSGKSLLADSWRAALCPQKADEIIAFKPLGRSDLEMTQTVIGNMPIEIHFKNVRQSLRVPGILGPRFLLSAKSQVREMLKQREHGGITILQNGDSDPYCKQISSLSMMLSFRDKGISRRRGLGRRMRHIEDKTPENWNRLLRASILKKEIQDFTGFMEVWRRMPHQHGAEGHLAI